MSGSWNFDLAIEVAIVGAMVLGLAWAVYGIWGLMTGLTT